MKAKSALILAAAAVTIFSTATVSAVANAGKIKMAFTIDDIPTHGALPNEVTRIAVARATIRALKNAGVAEAYGFINAGRAETPADLDTILRLWAAAGYPIGNHTFTHMNLNRHMPQDFIRDLEANEASLETYSNHSDWHYLRYPYLIEGDTLEKRNAIRAYLQEHKYKIAQVTDDFEDWAFNDPHARCVAKKDSYSIAKLKSLYLQAARENLKFAGDVLDQMYHRPVARILLMHLGAFDAEMLPALLNMYKKNGVEFISLSEAVRDPIYTEDTGLATYINDDFQYKVLRSRGLTFADIGIRNWVSPLPSLKNLCQ